MKPDSRKSLPAGNSNKILDAIREAVQTYMGMQGDKLDRGVTVRDLAQAGLIDVSKTYLAGRSRNPIAGINTIITSPGGGGNVIIPGVTYEPDLTPPPTPSGFDVDAGVSFIYIECAAQTYTEGHGHAVTNVYGVKRSGPALPTFDQAVLLTSFSGTVHAYPTDPATTYHLWIKWQTKDGVESASPAGGTNGLTATTAQDVRTLLNALTQAATNPDAPYSKYAVRAGMFYVTNDVTPDGAPLFSVVSAPITVGGVVVPAGVYFADGWIQNGTITNLKVANGAIDNLKIANVSADKLIAGSIAVGQYVQSTGYVAGTSGWRINGLGNVEFNNAIFRGQAFVGNGSIGGITILANAIVSSNYDGAGNGFRLGADGSLNLPGGSVSAQQLNVGAGANLLTNSQWVDQPQAIVGAGGTRQLPQGWEFGTSESAYNTWATNSNDSWPDWVPQDQNGFLMHNPQGPHVDTYMLIQAPFPVLPGRRYEVSVYSGAHRCMVYVDIQWLDGNRNVIGTSADGLIVNNGEMLGGRRYDLFKRIGCFGTAPPNAAGAIFRIIKQATQSGTDSYAFLVSPFAGAARPQQTVFSDYSPSGIGTRISPWGITTPSLSALTAVLGDCYAGSLRGGSFAGYGWPGDGGGGFYLGPPGLLLGNANAGRYVQITERGNFYLPGMQVEEGVLSFQRANIVNSQHIVQGAVTFALAASGNNRADIIFSIPAGEVWNIALFGAFGVSNAVAYGAVGDINNAARTLTVTNSPISDRQLVDLWSGGGPPIGWLFNKGGALFSQLVLGAGTHQLTAGVNYEVYAFNTPVSLMAFIFKR
ncbi:hypothetical protein H4CHR_04376 [Variovorax sp. PBS-H4]|uniref:phage tail tip fiber protein n=1 Tax=Variovorax sp. PBS-H4 TaxID=434008 RepID=UPI001318D781|nr:hypothetical protein [Variovorax sp. PBS-H4]VTU38247.1 hypothetical protein H4CHR_04376 [Variovorax sp. PBS-H4]